MRGNDADDLANLLQGLSVSKSAGAPSTAVVKVASVDETHPNRATRASADADKQDKGALPLAWKRRVKWPATLAAAVAANDHSPLELRPYQLHVVDSVQHAWKTHDKVLLQMPTGAGKTTVASAVILDAIVRNLKVLFVVNTTVLVEQAFASFSRVASANCIGFIKAGKPTHANRPLCIASIQTLTARKDTCHQSFDVVIVDEAHHAVSSTYAQLLAAHSRAKVLGLTATPFVLDADKSLMRVFDCLVDGPSYAYLIQHGFLVPPVLLGSVDGATRICSKDLHDAARLTRILQRWQRWSAKSQTTKSVAFACNVAHAQRVVDLAQSLGVHASLLTGKTPEHERTRVLGALASSSSSSSSSSSVDLVVSVMVLGEGWDFPAVDCLLMLRPTASRGLFVQQLGRGLRPCEGKRACLVIDETGSMHKYEFAWGPLEKQRGPVVRCASKRVCGGAAWMHPSCRECALCALPLHDDARENQPPPPCINDIQRGVV